MRYKDKVLFVIDEIIAISSIKGVEDFEIKLEEIGEISAKEVFNILNDLHNKNPILFPTIWNTDRGYFDIVNSSISDIIDMPPISVKLSSFKLENILLLRKIVEQEMSFTIKKIDDKKLFPTPLYLHEDGDIYVEGYPKPIISSGPTKKYYFIRTCIDLVNKDGIVKFSDLYTHMVNKYGQNLRHRMNDDFSEERKWLQIKEAYRELEKEYKDINKYILKTSRKVGEFKLLKG